MSGPDVKRPELGGPPSANEVKLCAGPLRMIFDHGDLRYITFRNREIIRRIYAAVRDRNWGTIIGTIRNLKIDSGRDFFHISYDSEHAEADISFVWHAEISGESNGTIKFTFDGEARSTFLKNRIGLCVLHPTNLAGEKCLLLRADGTKHAAEFPKLVAQEQPVRELFDLKSLSYRIGSDAWLEIEFEGDLFETEDQRNSIDDSYKTYSTPQHLPYPVEIQRGTRIRQSVALKLGGNLSKEAAAVFIEPGPVELTIDPRDLRPLPPIGLGVSGLGEKYSEQTVRRLRALNLAHLRVDLHLSSPNILAQMAHSIWEADILSVPFEVALTVPKETAVEASLFATLTTRTRYWTILSEDSKSTKPETLAVARKIVPASVPVGVGTSADFYQLNQQRPPWEEADFVCWSMNPQVHAFDDLSLAEAPNAIPAQIESAHAYFPGKPLHISPVTLKPRFSANSLEKNDELPSCVDPRQCSLFGAAWTLAAIKNLAQSGADSITFYETVGWRGVIERDLGSPLPDKFPSIPGGVYPLYFILRWINEWFDTRVVPIRVSHPNEIAALCLYSEGIYRLIVANLTARDRTMNLRKFPKPKGIFHATPLNQESVARAMRDPESLLQYRSKLRVQSIPLIQLAAHEILCVDFIN